MVIAVGNREILFQWTNTDILSRWTDFLQKRHLSIKYTESALMNNLGKMLNFFMARGRRN